MHRLTDRVFGHRLEVANRFFARRTEHEIRAVRQNGSTTLYLATRGESTVHRSLFVGTRRECYDRLGGMLDAFDWGAA